MHFKLIVVTVGDCDTDALLDAARQEGATGGTVITAARGEGVQKSKTFFGVELESMRDVILLLVEQHVARHILETISRVGQFDAVPGKGIAFQLDVEDAVGVTHQIASLKSRVEKQL